MRKKVLSGLRRMMVFSVLLLLVACGSKSQQKVFGETVLRQVASNDKEVEQSVASDNDVDGLEIPVYKGKEKLSQTVKKRFSYVVSYNHDTKEPNWVAWTLTADHASGDVPRLDFMDDDDMPDPKGYLSDYYNSGYDRGHMCPAGDNKWDRKSMEDCFLITNMCPQVNNLNRGIWNSIEQQCRAWAKKYGKIYIVCGPIFLNQQHRKLGKNKVVVPEAFFKVILCLGDSPKAIGFVCRNVSQKGKKKTDFVNSVDEVERITGYDFFSKLPDGVEDKVEAEADISQW